MATANRGQYVRPKVYDDEGNEQDNTSKLPLRVADTITGPAGTFHVLVAETGSDNLPSIVAGIVPAGDLRDTYDDVDEDEAREALDRPDVDGDAALSTEAQDPNPTETPNPVAPGNEGPAGPSPETSTDATPTPGEPSQER